MIFSPDNEADKYLLFVESRFDYPRKVMEAKAGLFTPIIEIESPLVPSENSVQINS
ncbi:MAG: hypothetical protein U0T81_08390 [Saprospiraceae bacterium]